MIYSLHALTNLGDSVITLPVAAVLLVWLAIWGNRRVALAWLFALIACGAVTAALKIYFKACPVPGLELSTPSGHTSMSLFVYGGLTLVTAAQTRTGARVAISIVGGLFVAAIAVSRVVLDYHSSAEVVIGVGIGLAALFLFGERFLRHPHVRTTLWPLWIAVLVPIVVLDGRQLSNESLLGQIALYIRNVIDFCV
jgi:membrane-associated phospholipid phosphatase